MRIKLQEGAVMPKQGTMNAAGYDMCALGAGTIYPGTFKKIRTGVHMEIPIGIVGTISHRSGLNSGYGLQAYGRVDADFRGGISVTLMNTGDRAYRYEKGDRIAQVVFVQIWSPTLEVVDELKRTRRGDRGHGSTGR